MINDFEIQILNQHFLSDDPTEPCSHGKIYIRVHSTVISDLDDGDWVINEAALSLMRTVRYGFPNSDISPPRYYPYEIAEETIINCCGAYMLFCPSNIKWDVTILEEQVKLQNFVKNESTEFPELQVIIPIKDYAQIIYDFAIEAQDFFENRNNSPTDWDLFDDQTTTFWDEYEELKKYIKDKYL